MSGPTQFEIINRALQAVLDVLPPDWRELMVNYHVDDDESAVFNTVVVEKNGKLVEQSLPVVDDVDDLLRSLREHLAQSGKPAFTQCKIHVKAEGQYEATYGYDRVDWDALLVPEWNFFPGQTEQD